MLRVIQNATGLIAYVAMLLHHDNTALTIGGVSIALLIFNAYTGRSSPTDSETQRRFF